MQWLGPQPLEFVGNSDTDNQAEGVFAIVWQDPTKIGVGDDYVVAAHPRSGAQTAYNWRERTECGCGTGNWVLHHDDYEDPLNDEEPIGFDPTELQTELGSNYQTPSIEVGAEIFINHDDDTQDGVPDNAATQPVPTSMDTDLYQVETGIQQTGSESTVNIWYHPNLKLWGSANKDPVAGLIDTTFNGYRMHARIRSDQFTDELYVEGMDSGLASVSWNLEINGNVSQEDYIMIDVVPLQWRGFAVDEGWHVSESRERQQMGYDGFLRTHYRTTLDGAGNPLLDSRGNPYPQGTNHTTQDAETWKAYSNGFEMTIEFEFDGDEFVDTVHGTSPGVSFFQNSGVYIYDAYEVQIFNTKAVISAIGNHSDPHEHTYSAIVDNLEVKPDGIVDSNSVQLHHDVPNFDPVPWTAEPVNGCITGIPYKRDPNYADYSDLNDAASVLVGSGTNEMSIDFTPDPGGGDPTIIVSLNGQTMFSGTTPVTGGGSDSDKYTSDQRIHLQSHWGSGVKFTDVEVIGKPAP